METRERGERRPGDTFIPPLKRPKHPTSLILVRWEFLTLSR